MFISSHSFTNMCTEGLHIPRIAILVVQTLPETELHSRIFTFVDGAEPKKHSPGGRAALWSFQQSGQIRKVHMPGSEARRPFVPWNGFIRKKQLWNNNDNCILDHMFQHNFFYKPPRATSFFFCSVFEKYPNILTSIKEYGMSYNCLFSEAGFLCITSTLEMNYCEHNWARICSNSSRTSQSQQMFHIQFSAARVKSWLKQRSSNVCAYF